MKYLLARANRRVLRQFAWSKLLVALDYDGTLAPVVVDPQRAAMRAITRTLLEKLAGLYPCVVISGRAQADALQRLRGVGILEVVGNHGVEPRQVSAKFLREVRRWRPILERRLGGFPGVSIEDKLFSLAVHYRRSREKKKARAAIREATMSLGEARVIRGKQVVNILPREAPHKGTALEKARAQFGCDTAIYVGDDETDEDVFALDQPGQLLTVRVGRKKGSLAAYYLRNQAEIDDLLRILLAVRRTPRTTRRGKP
jgi:trehalose 6-phosphate phosphatase